MDNPVHKGSVPPFPHGDRVTFTPKIGYTIESSATVLARDYAKFVEDKTKAGFACEAVPRPGTPYYEVSWIPRDDSKEIVTTWELAGNESELDIWLLPKVQVQFQKMIANASKSSEPFFQQHAFLQRVVLGKVNGDAAVPAWKRDSAGNSDMVPIYTTQEFRDAITFVSLQYGTDTNFLDSSIFEGLAAAIGRGVAAFPVSHYVVRRLRQLSANTTIVPEMLTANFIYTLKQFTDLEKPPAPLGPSLPPGYYQRKSPTMTSQRDGTWMVNEEWWHATSVDNFIYDTFAVPTTP